MTKLVKIAVVIAVGTVAIAATRLLDPSSPNSGTQAATGLSISPAEMMRTSGPLPETKVDSHF